MLPDMDLELEGKVVLVTGGSDGLGAALCRRLVQEGARVALCARDGARLERTAETLRALGGDVVAVQADVTSPGDIGRFVGAALSRWRRADGLVNNAGRSAAGPLEAVGDDEWDADLQLKLFAAIRTSRLLLPHLRAAGSGAIVNVLNIGAKAPGAGSLPTSVSRAAGLALTKALSREAATDGIRVNAVLIGLIESGQWVRQAAATGVRLEDLYAGMAQRSAIPLGRVGRSEEFADLAAYLLSARASYVTGTAINLDGGLSAVV
jgi:NAD(P)-dependent dehydrogenase (short-subunit alcohol dehydrogenase family)